MNYLAHAYLSFGIPEIAVGNMVSDFVKGKKKLDYPARIQSGISLHRSIDTFTDTHPVTRLAKSYFKTAYGLYSGPIIDVAYDYFLANDHDPVELAAFAQRTYRQLEGWLTILPERFVRMFPYMRDQDWLYNYRSREGIFRSFAGLSRRASYMPGPEEACLLFEAHYTSLESCYREFFPLLKDFAIRTLEDLESAGGSGKIE